MNHATEAALILDLIAAFRRSKTMFTAVRLNVFDLLHDAPQTVDHLNSKIKADESALQRLLGGCCALGLLETDGIRFWNTAAANRFLTTHSPDTLTGYINYSDQSLYPLWGHLEEAVLTGTNRWEQVFGSRNALFDHYFRDDEAAGSFLRGMHGFGQLASDRVARAFDLSRFEHAVDLGGATGHLSAALCIAWPNLHATVLDLPAVEKFARAAINRTPVQDRIDFVAADFFADPLPPADLYLLGRILHDWTEAKIRKLLDKIAAKLHSGGGVLIAETLLKEDKSGPIYSAMQDLNMLVCTEGRERTRTEYAQLLRATGFNSIDFRETGSLVDAVLAIKG
jgi:acetylserotonin N-methyltransferase